MDKEEKETRCCEAGYDDNKKLVVRCKVYSRYIVHDDICRCPDCSFAIGSRPNNKPVWRV